MSLIIFYISRIQIGPNIVQSILSRELPHTIETLIAFLGICLFYGICIFILVILAMLKLLLGFL